MGARQQSQRALRTSEAARFASEIVENPEYRKNLLSRAIAGLLPPAVENTLLYYRYGRPVEVVEATINDARVQDLTDLSPDELTDRAAKVLASIRALRAQEAGQAELLDDQSLVQTPVQVH